MIVARSRLHAVRYKLALDRCLRERGYPYQTLVAFSGTVADPQDGQKYTEAHMNGLPERQTAETFKRAEYRFLVVAYKFQTGFDQPLLAAMYVDQMLGGVQAVQTLSRLNRIHPDKQTTQVLDFANEAEAIREAFAPYYETTLLTEASDPNLLYDLQRKLDDFHFYTQSEVDHLAQVWFTARAPSGQVQAAHPKIYAALRPAVDRFKAATEEDQEAFRGYLKDYVRLYAFLSQVITFVDIDLEKLYLFGRLLWRVLPWKHSSLPFEVLGEVDLESYRLKQTHAGQIELERGPGKLGPQVAEGKHAPSVEELAALSEIVLLLNERFGLDIPPQEGEHFIAELQERLAADVALSASVQVNTRDKARLTFNHVVNDRIQDMLDISFKFYKLLNDDPSFAEFFQELMFKRYMQAAQTPGA
jgi:type I restriction enzyme R subunit